MPPINREDGGTTQLQTNEQGISSASQTIPATQFPSINIPDVITQDFFNPPPSADRQRIENELQQRRQDYLASFQQTAQEQQLQQEAMGLETQLTNLRQSEEKGVFDIEQQRIAMPLITGQEAALRRQGQLERGDVLAQLESKQKALGFETAKREGFMAKAKAALGFAESDMERIAKVEENQQKIAQSILDYSFKLREDQRNTLGTVLKNFEGMGWDDLSPQAQQQLGQLATRSGIPAEVLAAGLNAQKDQKDLELYKQGLEFQKLQQDIVKSEQDTKLAREKFDEDKRQFGLDYALKKAEADKTAKLDTSFVEMPDGSKALINNQTGQIIKEYPKTKEGANDLKQQALSAIELLETLPGKGGAIGAGFQKFVRGIPGIPGEGPVAGSDAAGYLAQLDRVKALLTLPNLTYLKGLGAMSDREFNTISASVAALNPQMKESAFDAEIKRIKEVLQKGVGGSVILEGKTSTGMKYTVIE